MRVILEVVKRLFEKSLKIFSGHISPSSEPNSKRRHTPWQRATVECNGASTAGRRRRER